MNASLNFVTPGDDGEVRFILDTHWQGTRPHLVDVALNDFRPEAGSLSLDREGFVLTRIQVGPGQYDDPAWLESTWFPAVRDMILQTTGASWVTFFAGPLMRFSNNHARSEESSVSAPARAVHADLHAGFEFSAVAQQPVADMAARDIAEKFGDTLPSKWRVYNIWQMISPPPQDNTLALCKLNTLDVSDIVPGKGYFDEPGLSPADIMAKHGDQYHFDITFFRENPGQQWGYFSNMQPGEALVFTTFDPEGGPSKHRVPHGSVDISAASEQCLPRNSIEIRALVVYE